MNSNRQRGFTLIETLVVVALVLLVAGMAAPKMVQIIDAQKLRTSAQSYAGLLQQARARAVADDTVYQVLTASPGGTPIAYVDLNKNQQFDSGGATPEPAVLLANPITVTDIGVPAGFDTVALLNVVPLNLETSPMVSDVDGSAIPGLAFNERGLPCQRQTQTGICSNNLTGVGLPPQVGWVTYFRYALRNGSSSYAAITVTPAGRVKTWIYQNGGPGGGHWQ